MPSVFEALELGLRGIEHPERGVAGAGHLARRLENLAKDRFQIELRDQSTADIKDPQELSFIQATCTHSQPSFLAIHTTTQTPPKPP